MRALDGITVVSLEHAIAAPYCTRQLADHGARVIKIERPGAGDFGRDYDKRARGLASHFVWTSRSKESVTLDIKQPAAMEIMWRLVEQADVLVQNLAPGATGRLGLDWESIHRRNPRLILCDISGYGPDGPYRDKKAYDLLIQSEAGLVAITGTPDEPAKCGASIADISAAMYALTNIMAALIRRGNTGQGSHIEISMLESMVEWTTYPLYYTLDGALPPERAGASHAAIYPYGPFFAGDGKAVILGVQNEREWQVFCAKVLGNADLAKDARFEGNAQRVAARAELRQIIESAFARMNVTQVTLLLDDAGIANARMNETAEVWQHPQLKARGRWTEIDTPAGRLPALLPPGMTASDHPRMDAVPALGQHTDAVLIELGYEPQAIAQLHTSGVI
jgi:itaconate CoA-transferase